jgi:hypothetical protein
MYLSGEASEKLYQSISPANTFRFIFSEFMGADLPLLDDRSYAFVDYYDLFNFFDVTEKVH